MAVRKRSSIFTFLISIVIIIVIVVVAFLFLLNGTGPAATASPQVTLTPGILAGASLATPGCTLAITGMKTPPSTIELQVMSSTCYPGDVSEVRVSVNGVQKGTMGFSAGSKGTFVGTSGRDTVIVVAKYSDGTENVVYQNMAL